MSDVLLLYAAIFIDALRRIVGCLKWKVSQFIDRTSIQLKKV